MELLTNGEDYDIINPFACIPEVCLKDSFADSLGMKRLYIHTKIHEEGGNEDANL